MRYILYTILFVTLSFPVKAMDKELPIELFRYTILENFRDWTEIEGLGAVCQTWKAILEDEYFWYQLFARLYGHNDKFNPSLSYRENCRSLLVCLESADCTIEQCGLVKSSAPRICQEICLPRVELSDQQFAMHLRQAVSHNAKVFCSSLGNCSCDFGPESLAALLEAKDKDVLVILKIKDSKPNYFRFKDCNEIIRFTKKKFPNLILVSAACYARCCEDAIDISVDPLADLPRSASLILADLAAHVRRMRPHLKAGTVSLLIKGALNRQLLNYRSDGKPQEVFEMVLDNT